jgi:predicted ATPase
VSARRRLPTGNVTFLFTDIEGSTNHLREMGADGYAEALRAHRTIIREAAAAHGGVEVDTQGDSFFLAFPTARGALAAAREATAALTDGPIRVRMGIHTGTARITDEGYVGENIHRAARIAAAAHGGQIVLSRASAVAVEAQLKDLGEHRLKGLTEPEWLFQLGAETFPPLHAIGASNLPTPVSTFVGRERELLAVTDLLHEGHRLVSLTGPGGAGKTRLAIASAGAVAPRYPNGSYWVSLATIRDASLVESAVAQSIGARGDLAEHIGERALLIVIDNFEHVVEAAPVVARLLVACPRLTVLVTSRETLRLQGEIEYPVPELSDADAVALFAARSGLQADRSIIELCRRLDAMPLAIELAAARAKALTPAEILERLSERLDLLRGGRDAEPRQSTLRTTVAWSYDLLPLPDRTLFASLAVFDGGATADAIREVCGVDPAAVESLLDKSLLGRRGERFWMLETIRQFATERLDELANGRDVRRRHAMHYLADAASIRDLVLTRSAEEFGAAKRHAKDELPNIRAARRWLLENDPEAAIDLTEAATKVEVIGVLGVDEARAWVREALDIEPSRPEVRAALLTQAGQLAGLAGDADAGRVKLREGLAAASETGDPVAAARAEMTFGFLATQVGRWTEAIAQLERAIMHFTALDQPMAAHQARAIMASALAAQGDHERATTLADEAVAYARVNATADLPMALDWMSEVRLRAGDLDGARSALREALVTDLAMDEGYLGTTPLAKLAWIESRTEPSPRAATLLGAFDRGLASGGVNPEGMERSCAEEARQLLQTALGGERFREAWNRGFEMVAMDAVRLALEEHDH